MEDIGDSMTDEERVLKYVIDLVRNSDTNKVYISKEPAIRETTLTEREIVRSLHFLQSDNLIRIIKISTNNDLSFSPHIELLGSGFHYFDTTSEKEAQKKTENRRFVIPTILSIVSVFISALVAASELGLI